MEPSDHPDADLVGRVLEALRHWVATESKYGPTSQITGGGAVAAVERWISDVHDGRRALLLPSATYALRIALQTVGVRDGDEVLLPAVDWPASRAAVVSLGAIPRPVAVGEATLTIDPAAARMARSSATRAVVACHLHGATGKRAHAAELLPDLPVIEDCAQAMGATLGGALVGTFADAAVLSFGPGKAIDAGEGGVLLLRNDAALRRATRLACHPVRQLLAGIASPEPTGFVLRPHPVAAMQVVHGASAWDPEVGRKEAAALSEALANEVGVKLLTGDFRCEPAGPPCQLSLLIRRTCPTTSACGEQAPCCSQVSPAVDFKDYCNAPTWSSGQALMATRSP